MTQNGGWRIVSMVLLSLLRIPSLVMKKEEWVELLLAQGFGVMGPLLESPCGHATRPCQEQSGVRLRLGAPIAALCKQPPTTQLLEKTRHARF